MNNMIAVSCATSEYFTCTTVPRIMARGQSRAHGLEFSLRLTMNEYHYKNATTYTCNTGYK